MSNASDGGYVLYRGEPKGQIYKLLLNPIQRIRYINIARTVHGIMAVCEVKVFILGM